MRSRRDGAVFRPYRVVPSRLRASPFVSDSQVSAPRRARLTPHSYRAMQHIRPELASAHRVSCRAEFSASGYAAHAGPPDSIGRTVRVGRLTVARWKRPCP
jgi:hypothetical protein